MKKLLLIIFPILFLSNCGKEFVSADFFPLEEEYSWRFSGPLAEIVVEKKELVASGANVTVAYKDSLGSTIWHEVLQIRDGRVFLKTYRPVTKLLPTVTFDPAIPITPVSQNRKEIEVFESVATHYDSVATRYNIRVENEIEEIEEVETPAGPFSNCIRLKTTISYETGAKLPMLENATTWWFAQNFGPVKYATSLDMGLAQAITLGVRQFPAQ